MPLQNKDNVETYKSEPPHSYAIVIIVQIKCGFSTEDHLVQFGFSEIPSSTICNEAQGRSCNSALIRMTDNEF